MQINDIFTKKNYTQYAKWANKNNAQIIKLENGKYQVVAIPEPLPPTKEEISEQRRQLYISLVDPLTSQIQRLRDEEQTEKTISQIESLKNERSELVKKIKEENPYPISPEVETNENLSLENG